MRGRNLTEIERALIDELYAAGMNASAIARHLQKRGFNRTRNSITPYIKKKYGITGSKNDYNEEEQSSIIRLYDEDCSYKEIAKILSSHTKRTVGSISCKIKRLHDSGIISEYREPVKRKCNENDGERNI